MPRRKVKLENMRKAWHLGLVVAFVPFAPFAAAGVGRGRPRADDPAGLRFAPRANRPGSRA
jgi:hypothetical protein